jgi:hypothetical protein
MALASLLFVLGACEPTRESGSVFVEVQTDFIPGEEMRSVRVTLASEARPTVAIATEARDTMGGPAEEAAFRAGLRIAEIGPLSHNSYRLSVELRDAAGTVFQTRGVRFTLDTDALAVRAVITRDCDGVACPGGGAPELTECYGARCVDPHCRPGETGRCPVPACTTDTDCPSAPPCATATCVSGACLRFGDSTRCGAGEVCDPETGCREPTPPMMDAGVDAAVDAPVDTGSDTGPPYDPNADPDLIVWVPMEDLAPSSPDLEASASPITVGCNTDTRCPRPDVSAPSGSGFEFRDGDEWLRIADDPLLVTTSGFTLAIWARLRAVPVTSDMVLLAKPFGGSFRNSWELGLVDIDSDGEGELSFVVDSLSGEATATAEHGRSAEAWFHVAAVWEPMSRRLVLYLDGTEVARSAESVTPSFDSSFGLIGADDNGSIENGFIGDLDDARVYRRALTAEEISAVMSAPPPP